MPKKIKPPFSTRSNAAEATEGPPDIESVRLEFRQKLPGLLRAALANYQKIVSERPDQDHKADAAQHSAARTALLHIQQLVRLAEWALADAGRKPPGASSQPNKPSHLADLEMGDLIGLARQETARLLDKPIASDSGAPGDEFYGS